MLNIHMAIKSLIISSIKKIKNRISKMDEAKFWAILYSVTSIIIMTIALVSKIIVCYIRGK